MTTRIHGRNIQQAKVRDSLPVRAEPYWSSLGTGRALGYRKGQLGGTWVARWTEPEKEAGSARPKYRQKPLGNDDKMKHAQAVAEAQLFFAEAERQWKLARRGIAVEDVKTVSDACRAYVEHLRTGGEKATQEKAEQAATKAEQMFKAHVYDTLFGATQLSELHRLDVQRWRDGLVTPTRAKNTVNRIYRSWKAAMNYVFRLGDLIPSDAPWKGVKPFAVQDGKRDVYLTLTQRQALLAACDRDKTEKELAGDPDLKWTTPALGDLLRGLALAAARPSELASARVSALDLRAKTLSLTSYKGRTAEAHTRAFPLDDPAALAFFKRMAKDKLPAAYLMTMADGSAWATENGTLRQYWAAGFRGARRLANNALKKDEQIPAEATAYSMRHSKITDWLEAGEPLQRVAVVTGTSIKMIERNYFKYIRHGANSRLAAVQSF
jgi:integrase